MGINITKTVLEPKRDVQEQFHALPDVDDGALVQMLAVVVCDVVFIDLVHVERLAREGGPERRARAQRRRAPPLAVLAAGRRRRRSCRTHRAE